MGEIATQEPLGIKQGENDDHRRPQDASRRTDHDGDAEGRVPRAKARLSKDLLGEVHCVCLYVCIVGHKHNLSEQQHALLSAPTY